MKKNKLCFLIALIIFYSNCQSFSINTYLDNKQSQLQSWHHPKIGIVIANKNGTILYAKNSRQYFASASIMKLFTASAATLFLGPSFRYTTNLLAQGKIHSSILKGNLYFEFSGDPSLRLSDLKSLLLQLNSRGVHTIDGNVFLDNHRFDQISYAPGTTVDDLAYSYASPVNAIIVNENAFQLDIFPGKPGKPPKIQSSLPNSIVTFSNQIISTKTKQKNCPLIITSNQNNHYQLTGCISRRSGKSTQSLAIRNISQATEFEIQQLLHQQKIILKGKVAVGKTPKQTTVIAMHFSPPLSLIIKKMLKESDNLISNDLVKTLCYQQLHIPGNFNQGLMLIKNKLSKFAHIDLNDSRISDGAGLSRYNLITPHQVFKLLIAINQDSNLRRNIIGALPIAGTDGTLENRMKKLGSRNRLQAKTGTLYGVSNIAGYLHTKHHGNVVVVFLVNQFASQVKPIRQWTDSVLTHLALN